jgi:hypothetical protein
MKCSAAAVTGTWLALLLYVPLSYVQPSRLGKYQDL